MAGRGGDYFGLSDRRNLPLYSVGIATAGGDCRFAFGRSLATSGLLLQTAFRNPLAGPDVFGISSGAGLAVAIVMLAYGAILPWMI